MGDLGSNPSSTVSHFEEITLSFTVPQILQIYLGKDTLRTAFTCLNAPDVRHCQNHLLRLGGKLQEQGPSLWCCSCGEVDVIIYSPFTVKVPGQVTSR